VIQFAVIGIFRLAEKSNCLSIKHHFGDLMICALRLHHLVCRSSVINMFYPIISFLCLSLVDDVPVKVSFDITYFSYTVEGGTVPTKVKKEELPTVEVSVYCMCNIIKGY
jgi:hypothetical protein